MSSAKDQSRERFQTLLDLLATVATKPAGVDVSPTCASAGVNVSIVLIGRRETIRHGGARRYVQYVKRAIGAGIRTFYLVARGALQAQVAREVASQVESSGAARRVDGFEGGAKGVPELVICLEVASPKDVSPSRERTSGSRRHSAPNMPVPVLVARHPAGSF